MSSKSDRDNHSNQLNPNNSAFWSSRSGDPGSDDEDDEGPPSWVERKHREDIAASEAARLERIAAAERERSQPPKETLSVPGPTAEELETVKRNLKGMFY